MKKVLLILSTVMMCNTFLFISSGFAAGFALPDQSAAAMGMASAFVGQADDATAVWFNPAAITRLDGARIAGGITAIYPVLTHENADGTTDVSTRTVHIPIHLYTTHPLSDKSSFGFGINNPFGLSTEWDPNTSSTRYVATFSKITTINLNPNIAYKFNDDFSAAVGIDYIKVDATMESLLPIGLPFKLSGDGDGWGANAALLYHAASQLNLGLTYRSRIKVDLEGDADVAALGISNPGYTTITLPDLIQLGASYKSSENLTLNGQLDYTLWSTYDRLVARSNTILAITTLAGTPTDTATYEKRWKDAWCLRIGGQYKLSDAWKLRAGYVYDQSPVREEYFETRTPDSDRQGLTIGAGYASGKITVDAAYMYLRFMKRTIYNSYADDLSPNPSALNGNYKSMAHLAGVTIGYKF